MSRRAVASSALAPGEPVAHGPLLGGASGHGPRRRRDLLAGLAGRVPGLLHLQLGDLDLGRDPLVLRADVVQELELVEQVGEAPRLEHDRQRGGRVGGVDVDEPLVQALHRGPVLALEEDELARLDAVELVQPVELALVEREHVLELVEPRGRAVDVVLERADLGGDDRDLGGEHALALAGRLDLLLEHVDAAVDDLLPLPDPFLPGGRRDHQEETGQRKAGEQAYAHPWVVSSGGRPSLPGRPASSLAAILPNSYCGPGSGTIAGVGGSPSSGGG